MEEEKKECLERDIPRPRWSSAGQVAEAKKECRGPKTKSAELKSMGAIEAALDGLSIEAIRRVLAWAVGRFEEKIRCHTHNEVPTACHGEESPLT